MDPRLPYATAESNIERKRIAEHFKEQLERRIGAINLMHAQHRYNLNHGSQIEREHANRVLPQMNAVIGVLENQIRIIDHEIAGFEFLEPLDPNSAQWVEEYQDFLDETPIEPEEGGEN